MMNDAVNMFSTTPLRDGNFYDHLDIASPL